MNALVDSTVWSLALRRRREQLSPGEQRIVQRLTHLILERRARIIGAIRQELLSGIRDEQRFERIRIDLRFFRDERLRAEDYEDAAKISNACRAAGIAGSSVDCLICAVSRRRSWPVFTLDRDFERYTPHAGITLMSLD